MARAERLADGIDTFIDAIGRITAWSSFALAAVMGLFLGPAVVPALMVAIAAGALVGCCMMLAWGAGARKQALPFGPFLALGGVVGLLVGDEMLDWYVDSFVG